MEVHTRVGDTAPALRMRVADADNVAFDLTGAAVDFYIFGPSGAVNAGATACVVTDPASGRFEYRWKAADVVAVGQFSAYFVIRKDGDEMTLPKKDRVRITVEAR